MLITVLYALGFALLGYLSGSLPFSIWITRRIKGVAGKLRGRPVPRLTEAAGKIIKSRTGRVIGIGAAGAAVGAGGLAAARAFAGGGRRRRGRGITSRELRGFRKVTRLLSTVGMVPRRLGRRKAVCR